MKQIIDFTKNKGLIPTIIQDDSTGEIYMLGYMNNEALKKTQQTGYVHFWSRSRQRIWMKGETSENTLFVKDILIDCDNDTILIKVQLNGKCVCHTGNKSCFYTKIKL